MALAGTDIALTVNPGWARARSPFSTNAIPRGERAGCAAASVWGRIPQAPLMSWLEKNPVHETDDIRPAAGEHGKPSGHFVARPECAPVCGPALSADQPGMRYAARKRKRMKTVLAAITIGAFLAITAAMITVNVLAISIW